MQIQVRTRVWFKSLLTEEFLYGYVTGLNVNNFTVIEESGKLQSTLQWDGQGYNWGVDPNPILLQNHYHNEESVSDGWTDGWTYPGT